MGTTEQEESVMMGLPEGYRPRKGDILTVRMVVDYVGEKLWSLRPFLPDNKHATAHFIDPQAVAGIDRRNWEVGDRIHTIDDDPFFIGEVLLVDDDAVLVKLDSSYRERGSLGRFRLFQCNDLELEPVPVAEPSEVPRPLTIEAADLGEDDDGASPQEDLGRSDPSPVRPYDI